MTFPNCNLAVYMDFNGYSTWLINEHSSAQGELGELKQKIVHF